MNSFVCRQAEPSRAFLNEVAAQVDGAIGRDNIVADALYFLRTPSFVIIFMDAVTLRCVWRLFIRVRTREGLRALQFF